MPLLEQEDTGACTKKLTIEVPRDKIAEQNDEIYKELREHAEVPGFRKGRAPRPILEMRFGRTVTEEAQKKSLEDALEEAAKELELKVVGEPNIHDVEDEDTEKPIRFQADVQYIPKIDLASYEGIELEVERPTVTDAMVDSTLEGLRQRFATMETVEDRPIRDGDMVIGDIEATVEGEPFPEATREGYRMLVGRGQLLEGFDEALAGKQVGEDVEVDTKLPEDYAIEKYRGKDTHFKIKIDSIYERKLPELDDEFARDLGRFESLDQLKTQIREDLEERARAEEQPRIREAMRNRLLEDNRFDTPPVLLEGEEAYVNALQELRLADMGTSFRALDKEQQDELRAAGKETAERRTRLSLVFQQIAEEKEVKLDEEEFEDYLEAAAGREGMEPGRFRISVENKGLVSYYFRLALEDKVLRFLLDQVKVKWVEPGAETEETAVAEPEASGESEAEEPKAEE